MKQNLILKKLKLKNVNTEYLKWMNDYEVTKFTEQRFKKHSLLDLKNFVKKKINQKMNFSLEYFLKKILF